MCRKKNAGFSVFVLILANMFPLGGVLTMGWQVFPIMLLFGRQSMAGTEFLPLRTLVQIMQEQKIHLAAFSLFLSHGFSFFWNFLKKREYLTTTPQQLMMQP